MTKIVLALLLIGWLWQPGYGQHTDTPAAYASRIQPIVASERVGSRLVHRLDSLQATCMPSRSYVHIVFNRDIDLGFKQRRLDVSLNSYRFQINLLCRHDTIFSSAITLAEDKKYDYYWYDEAVIRQFLYQRNQLYKSEKTASELLAGLATPVTYAIYCGDGAPLTAEGAAIKRWVSKKKAAPLLVMLTSFSCETQAFAVAGLRQLQQNGYHLPATTQALVEHIVARNAELVTCSGCLSGLVEKIYPLR